MCRYTRRCWYVCRPGSTNDCVNPAKKPLKHVAFATARVKNCTENDGHVPKGHRIGAVDVCMGGGDGSSVPIDAWRNGRGII